jgi:hypothetical protein
MNTSVRALWRGGAAAALTLLILIWTGRPALAQVTIYSDRSIFDSAHPALPTETFEAANIAPVSSTFFTGPLNSATFNAFFLPGSILPGISMFDSPGPDADNMVLVGVGQQTGVSKAVLARFFNDTLELTFSPAVPAAGFDLGAALTGGPLAEANFRIFAYDGVGNVLGGTGAGFFHVPSNVLSFWGIASTGAPITRISIDDASFHSELVDNIRFGVPEPAAATVYASLATLALLRSRRWPGGMR